MLFPKSNHSCHPKPTTSKADLRLVAIIILFQLFTSSLKKEDKNSTNRVMTKLWGMCRISTSV